MRKQPSLFVIFSIVTIILSLDSLCIAKNGDPACPLPIKIVVFTECQGGPCSSETTGDGAPYSSQFGSFRSAEIRFGTATNFNWHPFDLQAFGANLSGLLRVESDALYTFTLTSDDGSTLYIDGTPVVGVPEPHSPFSASGIVRLAAGIHSFEVHFFECCSGHSGVDLSLPSGVTYVSEKDCED